MKHCSLVALFALAAPATAQALLQSHVLPPLWSVLRLAPAGDTNGDGHADVAVLVDDETSGGSPTLRVLSGQTLAPLWTTADFGLGNDKEMFGFGDANGDQRSDIVVVTSTSLRVYSGSNGALLWAMPPPPPEHWYAASAMGDYDGNGRADLVVATYSGGQNQIRIRRGENGSVLQSLGFVFNNTLTVRVRSVGDLTGDGKAEVAHSSPFDLTMINGATGAAIWSVGISDGGSELGLEAIDVDADGRRELFVLQPGWSSPSAASRLTLHSPTNGATLLTLEGAAMNTYQDSVAPLGDLDLDGRQDFAVVQWLTLRALSGLDDRRLWSLPSWIPGQGPLNDVVAVGDLDGDGFGEFVASLANNFQPQSVHLLTAKVFAEAQPVQPACGGGPFFPLLGATRPMLGQSVTVVGQNNPLGVPGLLVLSAQPETSTWLGYSTCFAHFDPAGGLALAPLTQPQWSMVFQIPGTPQLAGFAIALQTWHTPTSGPRGNDLSNGIWARLGYP